MQTSTGYRDQDHCIPGFNLVVIDVDGGVAIDTAKLLLKDYTYLMYTTKRNTAQENRFRIIFPISHTLELSVTDFKEFMEGIYEWLPFSCDTQTGGPERKWLSFAGDHAYNNGKLLDALRFIPKTSKNEERKKIILDQHSLTNLERWFVDTMTEGKRSNQLVKYAYLLVDSGMGYNDIQSSVLALNSKLPKSLPEQEVLNTIMVTVARSINQKP